MKLPYYLLLKVIKRKVGIIWFQLAQERSAWRDKGEVYVQGADSVTVKITHRWEFNVPSE